MNDDGVLALNPIGGQTSTSASEKDLRVLYVHPTLSGRNTGDAVFHRAAISHLSRRMTLRVCELGPPGPIGRALSRAGLIGGANGLDPNNAIRLLAAAADFRPHVICLHHEYTFALLATAERLAVPIVLCPHNVHSLLAQSHATAVDAIVGWQSRRFERAVYGHPSSTLVCMSQADLHQLQRLNIVETAPVVAPGAPPSVSLAPTARIEPELVLTGTYGWWRKRRDLQRFAAEKDAQLRCYVDPRSPELRDVPMAADISNVTWQSAVRFGVITDRFVGGFKLKATEYIAHNCVVVGFSSILPEFSGIPHADEFVRTVKSRAEAEDVAREMAGNSSATIERFLTFKASCLSFYSWERQLSSFERILRSAARAPLDAARPPRSLDKDCAMAEHYS